MQTWCEAWPSYGFWMASEGVCFLWRRNTVSTSWQAAMDVCRTDHTSGGSGSNLPAGFR